MTRPLRLLYLLPAEAFGGAERQGVLHLAELPRHGVEVTALAGPGAPIFRALERARVRGVERFQHFPDTTHAPLSALGNARYLTRYLSRLHASAVAVEERVRGERYDLVFANRTFAWLVAAAVSRRLGIPYVIRAGSRATSPALLPALSLLSRLAPPRAMLANCRAVERSLGPWLGGRRFVVPNAIDTDEFCPGPARRARERLGLPLDVPLVGLAARPAPEKGIELLLRVARRVRDEWPSVRFVCAGEFAWRAHYEALLARSDQRDAFSFLGHVDEMVEFHRAMDVVVLTSRAASIEGSPNAVLEAMAVGNPVVATAVGGVPELVRHGVTGFVAAAEDDAALAHHLLHLLKSPPVRAQLGAAARSLVVKGHRTSVVVGELAALLTRLAFEPQAMSQDPRRELRRCESNTRYAPLSTC